MSPDGALDAGQSVAELSRRLKAPAGWPAKLGLGLGAAEESLSIVAFETFLLFYYTQVVGLSGSLAGAALTIALCVDAVLDPALGVWSDRLTDARFGRRHTIIIAALAPLALSSVLLFAAPRGLGSIATFLYLTVFCVIFRGSISGISIPLYAIGGELSRDPAERTFLLSLRTIGGGVGRLLAVYTAFTFFFYATANYPNGQFNPDAYPRYGVYVAALGVLLAGACIVGTYGRIRGIERLEVRRASHPVSVLSFFRELWRAFRVTYNLRVAFFVASFGYTVMALISVLKLHLATYFWRISPADTRTVVLAVALGMLVGAPLGRPIVRRLDRKPALLFGVSSFVAANLLSVALPALGLFPAAGTPGIVRGIIALQFLSGMFFGLFVVAGGSITADVADEHEVNTGKPQQGLVQGLLFFSTKLGSALATLIAGVTLDLIHFPITQRVDAVPTATVHRLVVVTAAVLLAVGVIVITAASRYDISAAKQREVTRRLAIAKAGE
jgi:Na+/melibiose symporter-like transporter